MEENKIIKLKPKAKHPKSKPSTLRPTTDNIQTNEIDPDIEKNIPKNIEKLNINAKEFIPKSMLNLYKANNHNEPKNYKINNFPMNITPYNVYYNAKMNPNFMQNYNNYQANNNFAHPSLYPNYPLNQGNKGNKNKEINNPQKPTLLKLDSKSFIPKNRKKEENKDLKKGLENEEENKDESKKDKKDENTLPITNKLNLNLNLVEYKPRNITLKQKEESIYPNKEENLQENKKDNPLLNLLSDSNKNTFAKKTSKKRDLNQNNEKITNGEEREEKEIDVIKKDLKDLLNKLTPDNYNVIKELILEIIKEDVQVQDKFIDVLFQKAVLEDVYVGLCSKLVKDLDKDLPQKTQRKEKNKKEYSEMRTHLIDKCRTFFKRENNEQFDEYIKEKDPEDRRNQLKKIFLGNVNFITELIKIKIISKKVGPDCLKNLYERYQKAEPDKTLRELFIEALIVFTENFGRIIYEQEKKITEKDKEEYQANINDIFKKLEIIKEEKGLAEYIKNSIMNLKEKKEK